jgi:diguanylate cyclase (GGDEF)-like protein
MPRKRCLLGFGAIAVVSAALFGFVWVDSDINFARARAQYVEHWEADSQHIARSVESTFRSVYENLRTLASLPSVRQLDRHGTNLNEETLLTFQQIYNNLASSVAISEAYILPVDFDPDKIDPVTGLLEEPIAIFDDLIVNGQVHVAVPAPLDPAAHSHDVASAPGTGHVHPDVEIPEYRQIRDQLQWFAANYPEARLVAGMDTPMIGGPEVITGDNTYFAQTHQDADRSGFTLSVPFYGLDGRLGGSVVAIILTNALRDLLPPSDFALTNRNYGYVIHAKGAGSQSLLSKSWVGMEQPDPGLAYSEVIALDTPDVVGRWTLWVGHPNLRFETSPESEGARATSYAGYAVSAVVTLAAIIGWLLILRGMGQATASNAMLERRVAERTAEIEFLATHDDLTGVANRAQLMVRMTEALARVRRGEVMAIHCLDIDHFKAVNDTLGHPAGDKLLRDFAARLEAAVREFDVVARFGGDEFVVVQLGITTPLDAEHLARRIIQAMSDPFEYAGHQINAGVSIGIAVAPSDGDTAVALLRNADIALYRSKNDGRGTFRFFEFAMDQDVQHRHELEADLRIAVKEQQFVVHYQPLLGAKDGSVNGFEALIRWQHPAKGLQSPATFIPLAEETGLIVEIGDWVLRQACRDAMTWPGDLTVSVNLSPAQFRQPALALSVVAALDASGLSPHRLELEITESALLVDSEETMRALYQFKELGIRIAMDDFGTGFSSLSYLRSFPFSRIKIDRSFVSDIAGDKDCRAIVSAVAALGVSLGMATTAEGVETREQWDLVTKQGCTDVQGYLFSEPRPAGEVLNMLAECRDRLAPAKRVARVRPTADGESRAPSRDDRPKTMA